MGFQKDFIYEKTFQNENGVVEGAPSDIKGARRGSLRKWVELCGLLVGESPWQVSGWVAGGCAPTAAYSGTCLVHPKRALKCLCSG